jgi:two-component system, OmpR family, sensor histidine kinase KdpD
MIETLLDVEQLEAGVLVLKRQMLQSASWLRASLKDWEMVAEARHAALIVSLADDLPPVLADQALLQRALDNLVANALNFTPEAECVTVSAFVNGQDLVIQVADHGPGVPENERERIFAKFAQIEGGQRRGSGLGLTFCRMVAEAHEGQISVSDNPTGGAVFSLLLPVAVCAPCPVPEDSLPARSHLLTSGR